jgi:ABC-2 type transport system permease protein
VARLTSRESRGQLAAIAVLRWQLFLHSLRTLSGRLEFVSRIFAFFSFAIMGVGGAIGLGFASWMFMSRGHPEQLAFFFWPLLFFWQLFPVMASAFAENVDFSSLLRFPLSFRSYVLVRIVFGASDPSTLVGALWLLGMNIGVGVADHSLFLWGALVCFLFGLFNILLARAIFSWVERWLATRRAREIMGVAFFLVIIGFQFIGPILEHFSGAHRHSFPEFFTEILPFQRLLPPGLAASSLAKASGGNFLLTVAELFLLAAYSLAALWILVFRLRSQYFGENLGEAPARRAVAPSEKTAVPLGWSFPCLSDRTAAILEKEFHYLTRSGPVLFTLVMPVLILLLFRFTSANSVREQSFLSRMPDYAFPLGASYSVLILTNILYNAFGAEGAGVQVLFLVPVRFREILIAKNICYGLILALEMLLVWGGTAFLFRPPALGVTLATLAGVLFAFLCNLAAGNYLSLVAPKKFDTAVLGRQRLPTTTVFATFGIQFVVISLGAAVFFLCWRWAGVWIAALALLSLAVLAFLAYLLSLRSVDRLALSHRESLIAELARA